MSDGTDAFRPAEIAERVAAAGAAKAAMAAPPLAALAVLAGAFIGFGALAYLLVTADGGLGAGPTRLLGGVAFATGLILVVIAGAELFTGDTLMIASWLGDRISAARMARVWALVYLGNFAGALALAAAAVGSGALDTGPIAEATGRVAAAKLALSPGEALLRGLLCNMLVCLAVWMSFGARRVSGKVLVIVPPIAVFVALGFEHSIANMFVLPAAMLSGAAPADIAGFALNLVFVTIGNVIGGAAIAATYWYVFLADNRR